MRTNLMPALLVCLVSAWFAACAVAQTYPLGQQNPMNNPQTSNYNIGWEFQCNAAGVTVVELGCNTPQPQATTVTLFDSATQGVLAQVSVPAGSGWRFVPLTTPVTLVDTARYRVALTSQLCGHHAETAANWKPTGTIQYIAGVYVSGNNPNTFPSLTTSSVYGMAEIGYTMGPTLTVNPTIGTAQTVFANDEGPGANGLVAGMFDLSTDAQGGVTWTEIALQATGSGDDSTAFTEVRIYRDEDNSGTLTAADVPVTAADNFAVDDGQIVFPVISGEQPFPASTSRSYLIVVKLAGTAMPGDEFDFIVHSLTVTNIGAPANAAGAPTNAIKGLIIDTPLFVVTDASPAAAVMAFPGGTAVCQAFTVAYPGGPDDKPADLTINTLGTADESADLVNAQLWWDFDDDASFVAGNDTLIDTQTFAQDNGSATFSLATLPDFQAGQTRRFFVVYNLGASAAHQTTFQCYVASLGAATLGGIGSGLPAPSNLGAPGLEVLGTVLIATLNGPLAASSVHSITAGDGNVLCDVTLAAAPGGSWTISTLTFEASGTGSHDGAFAELALHEDSGNGTWDGPATDAPAAPAAVSFSSNAVSFTLDVPAFGAGSMRRFFLVGKFNGTPVTGETFNARLESATAVNPPPSGNMLGFPTAFSTALVIDSPTLTVANSTSQPPTVTHRAGAAGSYTIALFTLTAMNNNATVNGLTLTTGGSGNWTTDVDSLTGVSVYHDDGDGLFNAADALLFEGGGGAVVPAGFLVPLIMSANSSADLWVRIGFTATAGQGAVAARDTFSIEVASDTDVSATVPVLLGTPLPQGVIVGAIEFSVTSFTPASDLTSGGKPITINGTGFVSPLTVTIGGTLCPGTPVIAGGTTVTGLLVPAGTGSGLPIVISSGSLPPQTIGQTFSYSKVGSVGGGSGGGGGGCASVAAGQWAVVAVLLMGLALIRRRRMPVC